MALLLYFDWNSLNVGVCFVCLSFVAVNAGLMYLYFTSYQKIDEEEYGGSWELTKEGFMSSFAGFLVRFWNISLFALNSVPGIVTSLFCTSFRSVTFEKSTNYSITVLTNTFLTVSVHVLVSSLTKEKNAWNYYHTWDIRTQKNK